MKCGGYVIFGANADYQTFTAAFPGIPLVGATLPVIAFFMLGMYGKVVWMLISALILGIGHTGIHIQHKNRIAAECEKEA